MYKLKENLILKYNITDVEHDDSLQLLYFHNYYIFLNFYCKIFELWNNVIKILKFIFTIFSYTT